MHPAPHRVLMIGATGVLGRPVARVLVADGRFRVSSLVRDAARARRLLPGAVSLLEGDLRDRAALVAALRGCDSVYMNLAHPFSPRAAFDPDYHGTRLVLEALREAGPRRVLRISALVAAREHAWWLVERKRETDRALAESGLPWTLFLPTWYMESLALFRLGPLLTCPPAPPAPLYWIAGEDYGRQVAAAALSERAAGRSFVIQGPEPVPFADALRRFNAAAPRQLVTVPVFRPSLAAAALFSARARYLRDLLAATYKHPERPDEDAWSILGRPAMRIEDYAASIARTGDWPRK